MKTYTIDSPKGTHWRTVPCAAVDCPVSASGWETRVDETTPLGARQAAYIRNHAARPYKERIENGISVFVFPAGAECFTEHRERTGRPDLFIVRGGDWRGIIGQPKIHDRPEHWVEDFAEHQDTINQQLGR
jgi:hypothetical protein